MKRHLWFIPVLCVLLCGCQKRICLTDLPAEIKVVKNSGITLRSTWAKDYTQVGAVLYGKTYKVLDGDPAYYKIRCVDNSEGWISAGADKQWTERTADGKVKILLAGGITVRKAPFDAGSPAVGVAVEKYSFDVLKAEYFYFKIGTPEGKQGWVYAGKPGDRWVEPVMNVPASDDQTTTTTEDAVTNAE